MTIFLSPKGYIQCRNGEISSVVISIGLCGDIGRDEHYSLDSGSIDYIVLSLLNPLTTDVNALIITDTAIE